MKKLVIAIGSFLLVLFLSQTLAPAQAQISVESRINRLESDMATLRNQLNQSGRTRTGSGINVPTPSISSGSQRTVINSDPRFDQLATLVIELKERINTLEQKVARLERPSR